MTRCIQDLLNSREITQVFINKIINKYSLFFERNHYLLINQKNKNKNKSTIHKKYNFYATTNIKIKMYSYFYSNMLKYAKKN